MNSVNKTQSKVKYNLNVQSRKVGFWLGMGIFFIPAVFSWFLVSEGYSLKARSISFSWMLFLIFTALANDHNLAIVGIISSFIFFLFLLCLKRGYSSVKPSEAEDGKSGCDNDQQSNSNVITSEQSTTNRYERSYLQGRKNIQTVEFSYTNAEGVGSKRIVDVKEKKEEYFSGYCHFRNEKRTFRYDRIDGDIVIISTGEVVSPENFSGQWSKKSEDFSKDSNYIKELIDLIESYGWKCKIKEEGIGFSAYRQFKNGKIRKKPDVYIVYEEFNFEGGKKVRPWFVKSNIMNKHSTFKDPVKAFDKFTDYLEYSSEAIDFCE